MNAYTHKYIHISIAVSSLANTNWDSYLYVCAVELSKSLSFATILYITSCAIVATAAACYCCCYARVFHRYCDGVYLKTVMYGDVRDAWYIMGITTARLKTKMVTLTLWLRSHLNWLYYPHIQHTYVCVSVYGCIQSIWQPSFELFCSKLYARLHIHTFTHT